MLFLRNTWFETDKKNPSMNQLPQNSVLILTHSIHLYLMIFLPTAKLILCHIHFAKGIDLFNMIIKVNLTITRCLSCLNGADLLQVLCVWIPFILWRGSYANERDYTIIQPSSWQATCFPFTEIFPPWKRCKFVILWDCSMGAHVLLCYHPRFGGKFMALWGSVGEG